MCWIIFSNVIQQNWADLSPQRKRSAHCCEQLIGHCHETVISAEALRPVTWEMLEDFLVWAEFPNCVAALRPDSKAAAFLGINTESALCTAAWDLSLFEMQRSCRPNANLNSWDLSRGKAKAEENDVWRAERETQPCASRETGKCDVKGKPQSAV